MNNVIRNIYVDNLLGNIREVEIKSMNNQIFYSHLHIIDFFFIIYNHQDKNKLRVSPDDCPKSLMCIHL